MRSPKVQIIVLNYNGTEILPCCLPSLVEAARKASFPTGVTLLDNCSTDRSVEWVRRNCPEVRVAQALKNRFLVSFNDYVQQIDEDIVILMNSDIKAEPHFVDPLVRVFVEHADAFMASPQSFTFDGSRYEAGRTRASIRAGIFWSSANFPGCEELSKQAGVTFASGFGAFHRKKFVSLGGYDDLYLPGIMEDADLGFRAWREGYRSYYVPKSRVFHMGQASFQKAFGKKGLLTLAHRNMFLFIWKNIQDASIWAEHLLLLAPRLIYALLRGKTEFIVGFFQALHTWPEARQRRKFPEKRARTDREVLRLANGETFRRRYLFKKKWARTAAALFDCFGTLLSGFLKIFKKSTSSTFQKILVVRIDSMGDGILTLPALRVLEKRFPGAQIDFLASHAVKDLYALLYLHSTVHVLERNWLTQNLSFAETLNEILKTAKKLKECRYDLAIDFRGDVRILLLLAWANIPHRWGRGGTGGGFLLTRTLKNPYQRHETLENVDLVQEKTNGLRAEFPSLSTSFGEKGGITLPQDRKKIVLHAGAGYPSKRWPIEKYLALAKLIDEKGLGRPIFVGTEEEKKQRAFYPVDFKEKFLDLTGKTSLPELFGLLQKTDLFIGNDSGPAHLAALAGCKLVVIFSGTNDFHRWAPWSDKLRIVNRPVPCSPCEERACPLQRQICLDEISEDEVFRAAEEMLSA